MFDRIKRGCMPVLLFAMLLCLTACAAKNAPSSESEAYVQESEPVIEGKSLLGETYAEMDNVYYLKNSQAVTAGRNVTNISAGQTRYLITYIEDNTVFGVSYDLTSGTATEPVTLYEGEETGDVQWEEYDVYAEYDGDDDRLYSTYLSACGEEYAFTCSGGVLVFYDRTLTPVYTTADYPDLYFSAGDGYAIGGSENRFTVVYPGGESRSFTLDQMAYGDVAYADEEKIILRGVNDWYDPLYAVCDLASGAVSYSGVAENYCMTDGWIVYENDNQHTFYSCKGQLTGVGMTYHYDSTQMLYSVLTDRFVTGSQNEEGITLQCHSLEGQNAVDTLLLTEGRDYAAWVYSEPIIQAGEYVIFPIGSAEEMKFLVWKTDLQEQPFELESLGETDYHAKNYDNANEVMEKYDVGLYYGDNATSASFYDYTVEVCDNGEYLSNAINVVTSTLDKMPDGFLDEVTAGFDGFDIYLTGAIHPKDSYSISDAAAFTSQMDGRIVIVMDVSASYGLESTFAHEFMHVIEEAILSNYSMSWFPGWDGYNPPDFSYTYNYMGDDGSTVTSWSNPEYTDADPASYEDVNTIYFVDGYGKTFPNEDRARIFEHLFADQDGLLSCFDSVNLRAKAAYLCQCLRENFPSLQNCDSIWWERYL